MLRKLVVVLDVAAVEGRILLEDGSFLGGEFIIAEANDEQITGGGAPGAAGIPADPGGFSGTGGTGAAGADANTNVHIHRNTLGDTDGAAGASDLDSRVHRWLNPVLRVIVTVQ